jgi:NDP-sugar pyrophosphorylase family protein
MKPALGNVTSVILAGGRGVRIQAIHPDLPKPMVPVAGKPFLHWLTILLSRYGLNHFVYSTGYRADVIEAWAADDSFPALTRVCRQENTALGTGGGLFNCLDACREWVLVANGDGLILEGISDLLALTADAGVDGGLLGVDVEDAGRYGSLQFDQTMRLTGFNEKVPGRGTINAGLYLFRRDCLERHKIEHPSSIERDLFPLLITEDANLRVIRVASAPFIDIGTPESLREADEFVRLALL